jgi:DNA-binding NarL/FixJ family response regulator
MQTVFILDLRSGTKPADGTLHVTPREATVLDMLCDHGMANKEIAARLGISIGSVKQYFRAVGLRTGMTTRTNMALWWSRVEKRKPQEMFL